MIWLLRGSAVKHASMASLALTLFGCDRFPLTIQNKTNVPIIVEYTTHDEQCDLAKSEELSLAPDGKFGIRCEPSDLQSVRFTKPDGQACSLTKEDVKRLIKEEERFSGSFIIRLKDC